MKKTVLMLIAALLLIFAFSEEGTPPDVARIHVIANSDSKSDIDAKMKVAGALSELIGDRTLESADDIRLYLEERAEEMISVADGVLFDEGMDYTSRVDVGVRHFDRKTLGNSAFPEGDYLAVTVTLGEGKGHNWWSVMYPNVSLKASLSMGEEGKYERTVLVGGNTIVKIRCLILDLYNFILTKR